MSSTFLKVGPAGHREFPKHWSNYLFQGENQWSEFHQYFGIIQHLTHPPNQPSESSLLPSHRRKKKFGNDSHKTEVLRSCNQMNPAQNTFYSRQLVYLRMKEQSSLWFANYQGECRKVKVKEMLVSTSIFFQRRPGSMSE